MSAFAVRRPMFGSANRAIASLAVQHLMGEKLDTERAERAAYLFGATGASPDLMIESAKKLAESEAAQEAKKHIENRDPSAALEVMSQQAEYDSIVAIRNGEKPDPLMQLMAEHFKRHPSRSPTSLPPLNLGPVTFGIAALLLLALVIATRMPDPVLAVIIVVMIGGMIAPFCCYTPRAKTHKPKKTSSSSNSAPSPPAPVQKGMLDQTATSLKLQARTEATHADPESGQITPEAPVGANLKNKQNIKAETLNQARGTVLLGLFFSGRMTDDFISPEELEAIRTQTFPEWPKELQEKMIPFGGEMVQQETSETSSPYQAAPSPSSPAPKGLLTQTATYLKMKGYSQEEVELLQTVPWVDLPQALKDKTVAKHDDPESQQMDPEAPMG